MAIGAQDPVLGEPVMRELQRMIRGCPEPMMLPQAGHFVQEHGEAIATAALALSHHGNWNLTPINFHGPHLHFFPLQRGARQGGVPARCEAAHGAGP